jgi:hypothetical protein
MINHNRFSVELPQGLHRTSDEWADTVQLPEPVYQKLNRRFFAWDSPRRGATMIAGRSYQELTDLPLRVA